MNKKLIIILIGILAILSLGIGINYVTSSQENPVENININGSENKSSNNNSIVENTTRGNSANIESSQNNVKPKDSVKSNQNNAKPKDSVKSNQNNDKSNNNEYYDGACW